MKRFALICLLILAARAAAASCIPTSGGIPLNKIRLGDPGATWVGCVNASLDTVSVGAASSGTAAALAVATTTLQTNIDNEASARGVLATNVASDTTTIATSLATKAQAGSCAGADFVQVTNTGAVPTCAQPSDVTGNAATATRLATAGSLASSGHLCIGIDASGNCIEGALETTTANVSTEPVTAAAIYSALGGKADVAGTNVTPWNYWYINIYGQSQAVASGGVDFSTMTAKFVQLALDTTTIAGDLSSEILRAETRENAIASDTGTIAGNLAAETTRAESREDAIANSTGTLNTAKAATLACAGAQFAQVLGSGSGACAEPSNITGQAATALALSAAGTPAGSGYLCRGVDASGNCVTAAVDATSSGVSGSTEPATSGALYAGLASKQAAGSYSGVGACTLPNVVTATNNGAAPTCSQPSDVTGNAATVTNGLYSTGSYADPSWLTSLGAAKLTGAIAPSVTLSSANISPGFNAASELVKLDASGKLPPIDGSQLTGIPSPVLVDTFTQVPLSASPSYTPPGANVWLTIDGSSITATYSGSHPVMLEYSCNTGLAAPNTGWTFGRVLEDGNTTFGGGHLFALYTPSANTYNTFGFAVRTPTPVTAGTHTWVLQMTTDSGSAFYLAVNAAQYGCQFRARELPY